MSKLTEILDHLTCAHHMLDKKKCVGCEPKQALLDWIDKEVIGEDVEVTSLSTLLDTNRDAQNRLRKVQRKRAGIE